MHTASVDLVKEIFDVFHGPVSFCHFVVVANVISCIDKRRIIAGIHPDGIEAQTLYVIQFAYDAPEVADAVAVAVTKALRINFIKNCVIQPIVHLRYLSDKLSIEMIPRMGAEGTVLFEQFCSKRTVPV